MSMKKLASFVFLTATLLAADAFAAEGTITSVTTDPVKPKPGEAFKLTVNGINPGPAGCTMDIIFPGKPLSRLGTAYSFPYNSSPDFTSAGWLMFPNPGTYQIKIVGSKTADSNCQGSATVTVKVDAPAINGVALSAAAGMGITGSPCPSGWHGAAQASGAVNCTPNKPATKMTCPPKTQYFETECAVGCQQIIY
jgi:hypothetical protein